MRIISIRKLGTLYNIRLNYEAGRIVQSVPSFRRHNDGFWDGDEVAGGTDPADADSRPVTVGDLDCNLKIDLGDAVIALRITAGIDVQGDFCFTDTDGNGRVGLEEAIYILYSLGYSY